MLVEQREDRADHEVGIAERIGREGALHIGDEGLLVAILARRRRRVPALIIDAADQHRQLRPEIGGLVGVHPVAQGVQRHPEQPVGMLLVVEMGQLVELVEPDIGLLGGAVQRRNSGIGHRASPS